MQDSTLPPPQGDATWQPFSEGLLQLGKSGGLGTVVVVVKVVVEILVVSAVRMFVVVVRVVARTVRVTVRVA